MTPPRSLALLLIGAAAASNLVAEQAPQRGGETWSLQRIDLNVELLPDVGSMKLKGKAVVRLEDESSLGPSLALNSRKRSMRYRSLSLKGDRPRLFFFPEDGPVEVAQFTLDPGFARGDLVEVEFESEFALDSMQLVVRKDGAFASWVEHWYPVPGSMEGGLASSAAAGTTTLVLPAGWRSVSNGVLESSELREGQRVEVWRVDRPAARSFAAGPYTSVQTVERRGRTVNFFLLRERPRSEAQADALARSIDAMEQRFGPHPDAAYSVAEVPEDAAKDRFAASSEQGFIMVRSSVLDDTRGSIPLFAHEAAHGWWGNLVRADGPGSKIVGESLAQYGAVIAIEAIEGKRAADEFLRFSREGYSPLQCALGYFYISRQEKADKPLSQLSNEQWDHNLSDSKGHWVHHMLRQRVGDEVFFRTLRQLIEEWSGRELTLEAFREAFLQSAPPDAGLERFFKQWLDRTGAPVLRVDWWSVKRGDAVEVHVDQLQGGDPYALPLEIELILADGSKLVHLLQLDESNETFTIDTASRALELHIDPEFRLLIWRPEYGPRPES